VYESGSMNVLQYPDMEIYGATDVSWSKMDQNTYMDSAVTSIDFCQSIHLVINDCFKGTEKVQLCSHGLTLHCRLKALIAVRQSPSEYSVLPLFVHLRPPFFDTSQVNRAGLSETPHKLPICHIFPHV
jgi:hypothetical protein